MAALDNETLNGANGRLVRIAPSFIAYSLFNITGGISMTNRSPVTKHSFALSLITYLDGQARWNLWLSVR